MSEVNYEMLERSVAEIDQDNVEAEMRELPSLMAYANAQYSAAHLKSLLAEMNAKRSEARLYLTQRALWEGQKAKFTEKMLEAAVRDQPEWVDAMTLRYEADAERERLKGYVFALQAKKDMLVSIGQRINAEMRADPLAAAQASAHRGGR